MWDTIKDVFLTIQNAPLGFWAPVLGLGVSVGLTQMAKQLTPVAILPRTTRGRRAATQLFALTTGLATVWGLWPNAIGFATGLFVGSVSLFAYKAARTIVALRWPTFAEHMSQDTREFPAPRAKR